MQNTLKVIKLICKKNKFRIYKVLNVEDKKFYTLKVFEIYYFDKNLINKKWFKLNNPNIVKFIISWISNNDEFNKNNIITKKCIYLNILMEYCDLTFKEFINTKVYNFFQINKSNKISKEIQRLYSLKYIIDLLNWMKYINKIKKLYKIESKKIFFKKIKKEYILKIECLEFEKNYENTTFYEELSNKENLNNEFINSNENKNNSYINSDLNLENNFTQNMKVNNYDSENYNKNYKEKDNKLERKKTNDIFEESWDENIKNKNIFDEEIYNEMNEDFYENLNFKKIKSNDLKINNINNNKNYYSEKTITIKQKNKNKSERNIIIIEENNKKFNFKEIESNKSIENIHSIKSTKINNKLYNIKIEFINTNSVINFNVEYYKSQINIIFEENDNNFYFKKLNQINQIEKLILIKKFNIQKPISTVLNKKIEYIKNKSIESTNNFNFLNEKFDSYSLVLIFIKILYPTNKYFNKIFNKLKYNKIKEFNLYPNINQWFLNILNKKEKLLNIKSIKYKFKKDILYSIFGNNLKNNFLKTQIKFETKNYYKDYYFDMKKNFIYLKKELNGKVSKILNINDYKISFESEIIKFKSNKFINLILKMNDSKLTKHLLNLLLIYK